jgi:hypothetical protein
MRRRRSWIVGVAAVLACVLAGFALVTSGGGTAPPPHPVANTAFPDAAARTAPAVVWAVGDGGDGSAEARAVARRIASDRPSRVLYLGDVYERGSPEEFQRNFAAVYGRLVRSMAPTPGNHDWPAHREGYDPFWRSVTGDPTPPWYAFRAGGWRVLSLNTEAPLDPGSAQLRWLHRQLGRAGGTCALAFWHRPRFSAGSHGDQPDVAPLWEQLRGHAVLVVSGHDHDLQRFRPIDGITQLVSGAGGRHRYPVDAANPSLAFADDDHDGALRLALRPGRADVRFVTSGGSVLDRSTVRCRPSGVQEPRSK